MFTGIVLAVSGISKIQPRDGVIEITVFRPSSFKPLKAGGSIAVDGVCLTIEKLKPKTITFALAEETLKATGWNLKNLKNKKVNLEPALKMGDRLGGHLVTGHIDGMAKVKSILKKGENISLTIQYPPSFEPFFWKKGYIAVNGVSLTIHEKLKSHSLRLGLVPETLKRTNLSFLKKDSLVTFEVDSTARALLNFLKTSKKATL